MCPKALRTFSQDGGQAGTLLQAESTTSSLLHGNLRAEAKALPVLVETHELPKSGQDTTALDPGAG